MKSDAEAHLEKLSDLKGKCPTCESEIDMDNRYRLMHLYQDKRELAEDHLVSVEEELELARTNNLRIGRRDALQKEFEEVM